MAEGEFALIRQHLDLALQRPPVLVRWGSAASDLDLYVLYAEHAAQQKAPDLLSHARRALEAAVAVGHPLYEGIAQRALGVGLCEAGEWSEAEAAFNRALGLFQAMPARWQAALTLVERAELERRRGDLARSRSDLDEAFSEFQAIGAGPDARRTAQALRELQHT